MKYVVILLTLVLTGHVVWAQDEDFFDSTTFSHATQVFDRAQDATSVDEWHRITNGIYATASPEEHDALRRLEAEALAAWVARISAGSAGTADLSRLVARIGTANLQYLYDLDPDSGDIQYDDVGDAVLQRSDGWLEDEESAYRAVLQSEADALFTEWEARYVAEIDALVGLLDDDLAAIVRDEVAVTVADYERRVAHEYARMIDQAVSRVAYGRLRDTYSERRKSENANATSIAASLIHETTDELDEVSDVLLALIPEPDAPSEELRIDSEEWQASFRREFENGLSAWERAEERFFREHIEWEERTQVAYRDAEAQWDSALAELVDARDTWVREMQSVINAGTETWDRIESSFERDYQQEMEELRSAADSETRKLRDELNSYVTVFDQAARMIRLAEENARYFEAQIESAGDRLNDVNSQVRTHERVRDQIRNDHFETYELVLPTFDAVLHFLNYLGEDTSRQTNDLGELERYDDYEHRLGSIARIRNSGRDRESYLRNYLGNAYFDTRFRVYDVRAINGFSFPYEAVSYLNHAGGRYSIIAPASPISGTILELQPRTQNPDGDLAYRTNQLRDLYPERDELATRIDMLEGERDYWRAVEAEYTNLARQAWSSVLDLDATFGDGETAYDETSREVERLRRREEMLIEQVRVSQAVVEYAEDLSSDRPTEAQTTRDYEAAHAAAQAMESAYIAALDELTVANRVLFADAQNALDEAQSLLNDRQAALDAANDVYQSAYDVWINENTAVFDEIIAASEERLDAFAGSGDDLPEDRSRAELYAQYAGAWEIQEQALTAQAAQDIIADFAGLSDHDEFEDRHERLTQAEAIEAITIDWDVPGFEADLRLALTDPGGAGISSDDEAYVRLDRYLLEALSSPPGSVWEHLVEHTLADMKRKAWARVDEADLVEMLLSSGRFSETDPVQGVEETIATAQSDYDEKRAAYFAARAQIEIDALRLVLDPLGGGSAAAVELSSFFPALEPVDVPIVTQRIADLQRYLDGSADDSVLWSPTAPFVIDGLSYVDAFLDRDVLDDLIFSETKLLIARQFTDFAPAVLALDRSKSADALEDVLADLYELDGIVTEEQIESIWTGLVASQAPEYVTDTVAMYLRQLDAPLEEIAGELETVQADSIAAETELELFYRGTMASPEDAAYVWRAGYAGGEALFRDSLLLDRLPPTFMSWEVAEQDRELAEIAVFYGVDSIGPVIDMDWLNGAAGQLDLSAMSYDPGMGEDPLALVAAAFPTENPYAHAYAAAELIYPGYDHGSLSYVAAALYTEQLRVEATARADERRSRFEYLSWIYAATSRDVLTEGVYAGAAAFQSVLNEMIAVYRSEDGWYDPDTVDESLDELTQRASVARADVLGTEHSMVQEYATLLETRRLRDAVSGDRDAFFAMEVLPAQEEVDRSRSDLDEARSAYENAIADFTAATEEYRALVESADGAYEDYRAARVALQIAEEINDFALSGYQSGELEPRTTLERREAELERTQRALAAMEDMLDVDPVTERLDARITLLVDQENAEQVALQEATVLANQMARDAGRARFERDGYRSNLASAVNQAVSFEEVEEDGDRLLYTPRWDDVGRDELVGRASEFNNVDGYFSGDIDDISAKFATDATSWLVALNGNDALLRTFGLAWYYESVTNDDFDDVEVPIADNSPLERLLDDYINISDYPSFTIGHNDETQIQEYLKHVTRSSYLQLRDNPEYQFFRLLMRTERLTAGQGFIGRDVSKILRDEVNDEARDKQRDYSRWWRTFKRRKARQIKALRRDMPDYTGERERREIVVASRDARSYYNDERSAQTAYIAVTGGQGVETSAEAIRIAEENLGRAVTDELAAAIGAEYESTNPPADALEAVSAAVGGLHADLQVTSADVSAEMGAQRAEWHATRDTYVRVLDAYLKGGEMAPTWEDVQAAMDAAYAENDYFQTAVVDARLANAHALDVGDTPNPNRLTSLGGSLRIVGSRTIGQFREYMDATIERRQQELDLHRDELTRRRDRWLAQMSELIAVGSSEWSDGVTRINAMRKSWREDVEEDYNRRLALWNARYALLQDGRSRWIEEATVTAVGASAESMGLDLEQSAASLIAGSEMLLIQEVIAEVPDLETVVSDTLNSPALTDMIAHAERLNTRARGPRVVAAYLPTMRTSGAAHELALRASNEIGEEVAARAALVTALQMADQVRMIEDGLVDGVADTNTQVESSVRTMMENSGYQLTGIRFRRKAIIDESLFGGVERETQYVSTYRHFIVPELELGVDLSRESLENRSARTIQASVTVAQKALEDYQTLIFGRDEDEDDDPFSHASAAFARQFEAAETAFMNSAGYNRVDDEDEYLHHDTDGLFNWHVGYAPTMQQKNPEKVDEAGYGEMGRIMEAFMINEARQQRGMANFDTPTYALKMWDDDKDNDGESDGFFGAPSIKDITNVAVSVAAYSLGAGPLVTAAINLVDDAVFTAADVATGFRKADEAWGSFGKQAAVSIASASVSGAFNGFGGNAGTGGLNNLVDGATKNASAFTATSIDIGLGAAQGFTTNAVSGAISSYDFSSGKFDSKSFQNAIVGESALAGYAGNAVQTGARAGMTGFLSTDGTGVGLNGAVFNTAALHAMAGVGGSLAGAAIDYAIDGDATVNLVHTRMFGAKNSTGLLEMNLGGDGSLFNLGMGGYDVGVDQVYTALQGIGDITRVSAAKLGGALGTERGIRNRADLNLVNYNAIAGNLGLAVGVWNRDITTRYEDLEEDHYGYYNHGEDPTTIVMNDNLLTNDRETAAMLASVAAHEGTHLFDRMLSGSTTEANAHLVGRTVYNKLVAELELNGNTAFSQSIEDALADSRSYLPNQGPVDNWMLIEDGSLEMTEDGWLKDPNGNYILDDDGNRIGAEGIQGGLQNILGIGAVEAAALLRGEEFELREEGVWWNHEGNAGRSIGLDNERYAAIYDERLAGHNTENIYNDLVARGLMDTTEPMGIPDDIWNGRQPDVISYEQWKEQNFITGEHNLSVRNIVAGSEVTAIFGATGSYSANPHTGVDLAVPAGTPIHSMFGGDTRFDSGLDASNRAVGIFQQTETYVTYTFKGEPRTDSIYTRYLHLQSRNIDLTENQLVFGNTQLGLSGNTGLWPGVSPYGNHLHVDITTQQRSPLLDSLLNNSNQRLPRGTGYRYDPFIFLDPDDYIFRPDAHIYGD